MLSSIGPAELVVVLIIALLVLGPKRLPEAGRGLGRGIREFKDSLLIDHGPRDHGETNTPAETDTGRSIEIHAGGE